MNFKLIFFLTLNIIFISSVSAEDQYKIGVSLPLTGEGANVGNACKNGITLAREDLPADLKEKITVELQDDGMIPKNTVGVVTRFLNVSKVNALIALTSGCSNAVAPIAESKKTPLIAVATDPQIVKNRTYVFSNWVMPETESKLLSSHIIKQGYKKIAKISAIHDMYIAMNKTMDEELKGKVDYAFSEEVTSDLKDFKPILIKLKSHKDIDAISVGLWMGQIGIFAKQARELGINLPLLGYEFFEDPDEQKASQGTLVGQYYVNAADAEESFLKRYNQRFPNTANFSAANCYDAVTLFANALKQGKKAEEYLSSLKDFSGALGTYSATGDHRFTVPAAIKVITKDGYQNADR